MIDCASITLVSVFTSIIFIFAKKALLAQFALLASFEAQILLFIDHTTNFFGLRSVFRAYLSNKIIFLPAYCHIRGA